jgi:hypothetical protein
METVAIWIHAASWSISTEMPQLRTIVRGSEEGLECSAIHVMLDDICCFAIRLNIKMLIRALRAKAVRGGHYCEADMTSTKRLSGFLGPQFHTGRVQFRNLRLQEIS